jgi:hypothetical protein
VSQSAVVAVEEQQVEQTCKRFGCFQAFDGFHMNMEITITEEQAKVVMQALDGAIRSGGANTAVVVLPVMQAIEEQLKKQD